MKNQKIKRMVGISLLMAMIIVLQFVGSMIPPIGGLVSISLVLIPIVLGAAAFGPGCGAFLGAVFSVIVIINCITGADVGGAMVFQANPVLCILVVLAKGILAGLFSGLVYKLLHKKNAYVAMLCAAIVCPLVNTGVFDVKVLKDHWTTVTADGKLSAHYENTVLITDGEPEILTVAEGL